MEGKFCDGRTDAFRDPASRTDTRHCYEVVSEPLQRSAWTRSIALFASRKSGPNAKHDVFRKSLGEFALSFQGRSYLKWAKAYLDPAGLP